MYNVYSDDVWALEDQRAIATEFCENYEQFWAELETGEEMPEWAAFTMSEHGSLWVFLMLPPSAVGGQGAVVSRKVRYTYSSAKHAFYEVSELY